MMTMENEYKKTKTMVSYINYYFVFCSRYKRKIFNITGVEERFIELTNTICKDIDCEVEKIECNTNLVELKLNASPNLSPNEIMYNIKSHTSTILRNEFAELSKIPSLWTRKFFVSTEDNPNREVIRQFVDEQKTR